VLIRRGHSVSYDVKSDQPIRVLHIAGTVTFVPNKDTRLEVGLLRIQPDEEVGEEGFDCGAHLPARKPGERRPALLVGTPDRPIVAKRRPVDIRTLSFVRFEDNECHCDGLYGFNLGEGVNRVGPDARHPLVIRNMKIWRVHYAFRPQSPCVLVDNMRIYRAEYGVYHPNYDHHVYRNLYIGYTNTEPFNRGHDDFSVQYGPLTVDGLTFEGVTPSDAMPLIQISDDNPTDKGKNCHAKEVSTRAKDLINDGSRYRAEPPLTGDESRVAEVRDIAFPTLLKPVDDLPPTTVITRIERLGAGRVKVRGTAADNGSVTKVMVNDRPARAVAANFAQWEIVLEDKPTASWKVTAWAIDAAGNKEQRPHVVVVNPR
jgi:hypothetical protein